MEKSLLFVAAKSDGFNGFGRFVHFFEDVFDCHSRALCAADTVEVLGLVHLSPVIGNDAFESFLGEV